MANAVAPRIEGDEYQSLCFWYFASLMLSKDFIEKICYESDDVEFVDDIIVFYKESGVDAGGWKSMVDYFQVKYHVDNRNRYNCDALIDPNFSNSKKSMLQRFYDAYEQINELGFNYFRMFLISNWDWDQNDPLYQAIRESDGSLPNCFFEQNKNQPIGKIRESWKEHLKIDDKVLIPFAKKLRFQINQFGRRNYSDLVMSKLENAGLVVPDDRQVANIYSSITRKLVMDKVHTITKESLIKICEENGLLKERHNEHEDLIVIGIRSFIRFAERIEDECDSHICVSKHFSVRSLRSGVDWNDDIANDVKAYLNRSDLVKLARKRDMYIMLECHGSIAFLAGYLLPRKSGANIFPIQKGIETMAWKPDAGNTNISADWGWERREIDLNSGAHDNAIAISITHDISVDVQKYIEVSSIPVRSIICLRNKLGVGPKNIEGAEHAIHLGDKVLEELSCINRDNPGSVTHIFCSAPNGFMFYLGRGGDALGSIQLYEFDFTNEQNRSYSPSIKLPL